jgi:hypothetical protein
MAMAISLERRLVGNSLVLRFKVVA